MVLVLTSHVVQEICLHHSDPPILFPFPESLVEQGISKEKLQELRTQKPEVRAAARQNAARLAKEKNKAAAAAKKATKVGNIKREEGTY